MAVLASTYMESLEPLSDGAESESLDVDWEVRAAVTQERLANAEQRCAEARSALHYAEVRCDVLSKANNEIVSQLKRAEKSLEEAHAQIDREIGEKEEAHIEVANEIAAREQSDAAVQETRARLANEMDARKQVEAALSYQQEYSEELKEEVRSCSIKIRELLEERSSLVEMTALRIDRAPMPRSWSPCEETLAQKHDPSEPSALVGRTSIASSVDEAESGEHTQMVNLSDFLNLADHDHSCDSETDSACGDRTPRESAARTPQRDNWMSGAGQLRSYLQKSAAKQPNWRSMLTRALGGRQSGTGDPGDEIQLLLPILAEVPPTRHVVRGVVGADVERLRHAVATAGDVLPKSTRGALWSEAVGNRLRLSEEQYMRTVRRRNRLRIALEARGRNFTADSADLVEGMEPDELCLVDSALQQISLDLGRTLSTRAVPELATAGDFQGALQDVLEAFVVFKPEYGYTQGMSFLAALMVLHLDIYHAFTCFTNAVLLQPWLSACYSFEMSSIRCYFEVFDELLHACVPKISRHFQAIEFQSEVLLVEWWFTLFARSLPLDIVVRLWDMFFLEGDFLLFRASLAIMQHFAEPLLARARDECLALLASWPFTNLEAAPFFETFEKVHLTERRLAAAFAKIKSTGQEASAHRKFSSNKI